MSRPKSPCDAPQGIIANKFHGAQTRCAGLSIELEKLAKEQSTMFFDTASATEASKVDGIHLDEDQHRLLGQAIARDIVGRSIF